MTFVLVYGPPAVGKLTVATELAKLTGFKLFHNHVSVDVAESICSLNGPSFGRVVKGINQVVFQEAAQGKVDLIFTFVYAHPQDDPEIRWMLDIFESGAEEKGARILLVQLTCEREALRVRLGEASRQAYGKVKGVETLEYLLETYDLFTPYPAQPSLQLDTTHTPPSETAAAIAAHLKL